jgi:hypothetical protein
MSEVENAPRRAQDERDLFNPFLFYQGLFIPNYILTEEKLSDTEKLLYAFAVSYQTENEIPPTTSQCAEGLNWNTMKVNRVAKRLLEKGVIK